jgi:hypothetical protein
VKSRRLHWVTGFASWFWVSRVLRCPDSLIVVTVGGVLSMALRVLRMAFGHH